MRRAGNWHLEQRIKVNYQPRRGVHCLVHGRARSVCHTSAVDAPVEVTAAQARTGKYSCPICAGEHLYDPPQTNVTVNAEGFVERDCLVKGYTYRLKLTKI